MNLNFVMAGMMLTLFVLFLAEGVCAMLRKESCKQKSIAEKKKVPQNLRD